MTITIRLLFNYATIFLVTSLLLSNTCNDHTRTVTNPQLTAAHTQLKDTNNTQENPFRKLIGNWSLKEGIWESSYGGKYSRSSDTSRLFIAKSPTNQSLLWDYNLVFAKGVIMWTFNKSKEEVYHLSSNSNGPMAQGSGSISANGDVNLKLSFDGECKTCYRIYRYKFITDDEISFRANYYKDGKETGDFYGATFVKKN